MQYITRRLITRSTLGRRNVARNFLLRLKIAVQGLSTNVGLIPQSGSSTERLSNMPGKIHFIACLILLSLVSCARVKQGEVKTEELKVQEIKARAEETLNSFLTGDYQKQIDLTYPKLVELMGGREKMISTVKEQMAGMKGQGFDPISTSVEVPKEIVPADSQLFAIVPYTLKIKTPKGVLTQQSYMLAISDKDNVRWTFIDVTGLDETQLKAVVPGAVGKLTFPQKQPPVLEQNP